MFSSVVRRQWIPADLEDFEPGQAVVCVDPDLPENRALSILRLQDGPTVLRLSPERAAHLGVGHGVRLDTGELSARLAAAGVSLHDADHLFYLDPETQGAVRSERPDGATRRLTSDDAEAFERFVSEAPEDDLDEAFVELDHWLVFGTFVDAELASVASVYPWTGTRLADLGVITLPTHRGRGLGRRTVRSICAAAIDEGFEPQYRCQLDNHASVALARASGFTPLGTWEVVR